MSTVRESEGYHRLRAAALDAIVEQLRASVGVDRCTLRLEVPDEFFPVVHESLTGRAGTLIGDRGVSLQGQPVVEAILSGARQVVQTDCPSASEDPAFRRMLEHYGGLGAQIVTPVRAQDGRLLGIISLHHLGGAREWSQAELGLARDGAELVGLLLRGAPA
jgi:GAF domain-containing protein